MVSDLNLLLTLRVQSCTRTPEEQINYQNQVTMQLIFVRLFVCLLSILFSLHI